MDFVITPPQPSISQIALLCGLTFFLTSYLRSPYPVTSDVIKMACFFEGAFYKRCEIPLHLGSPCKRCVRIYNNLFIIKFDFV